MEGVTCGTSGHGQDCLCDVIIHEVTPICVNAVQGLWMGQEVADACGLENWDDDQELLTYLCNVLMLHDRFIEERNVLAGEPEQMATYRGSNNWIHPYRVIRVDIRHGMCEPDARIMDVLERYGYTAEQFTKAASSGHWEMDAETLQKFEQAILEPDYSYAGVSAKFGLPTTVVRRFRKFWPNSLPPTTSRGFGNKPHNIRMRELITAGMRTNDIVDTIKAEFDITITKSAVSQVKKRYNLGSK